MLVKLNHSLGIVVLDQEVCSCGPALLVEDIYLRGPVSHSATETLAQLRAERCHERTERKRRDGYLHHATAARELADRDVTLTWPSHNPTPYDPALQPIVVGIGPCVITLGVRVAVRPDHAPRGAVGLIRLLALSLAS